MGFVLYSSVTEKLAGQEMCIRMFMADRGVRI